MSNLKEPCPCSSGKNYENCCKPFHDGLIPENALLLMRSRYSAYVLNIPDYIMSTTHPASPEYIESKLSWKRGISKFSKETLFQKLEVLDFKEKGELATVTFTAHITQNNIDATFTEKSYFEKLKNRWFYRTGQIAEGYAPDLISKQPLRILPLAYYGDPVLRKIADPIISISDEVKKLVEDMLETMKAGDGVGLAAPQVHHSLRLFIIREQIELENNEFEEGEIIIFINPKLFLPSEKTWMAPEGCLSIPTLEADVERPNEITVEYTTLEGQTIQKRFSGWNAKIIMHENDHINGCLFIDRLDKPERIKLDPHLQNLEKRLRLVLDNDKEI